MAENSTVKLVYKKLLTAFLLAIVLAGCATADDPYSLSNIAEIRELEKQDHKLCTSLKLNFDRKDNFLNRDYWHCRISFAKYRLSASRNITAEQARRDEQIRDLVTKISLKISATPESVVVRENQKMDERDHKKCVSMGFELDTEDQTRIEDYFSCRKVLMDEQQVVPPYGNLDYLQFRNHSYNVGFIVDQRVTKEIARYNETKEKYPSCVSHNIRSLNFRRCAEAADKSRLCFEGIAKKRFRREGDEKVICQRQAYIRFSDVLMKKDEQEKKDRERKARNSDYYNNQSFASLGIDETKFFTKGESEKKESAAEINSKAGLYEKFELTKLRQKFVVACQQEATGRIEDFVAELKNTCEAMEKFEVVGEE